MGKKKASIAKAVKVKAVKVEAGGRRKFNSDNFYKKYPHVVPGSVVEVSAGEKVGGVHSHGRRCQVTCSECSSTREVNVQDAWQVKRCDEHQKLAARKKAAQRRASKVKKASKNKVSQPPAKVE